MFFRKDYKEEKSWYLFRIFYVLGIMLVIISSENNVYFLYFYDVLVIVLGVLWRVIFFICVENVFKVI